jgi:hypothetical protein
MRPPPIVLGLLGNAQRVTAVYHSFAFSDALAADLGEGIGLALRMTAALSVTKSYALSQLAPHGARLIRSSLQRER